MMLPEVSTLATRFFCSHFHNILTTLLLRRSEQKEQHQPKQYPFQTAMQGYFRGFGGGGGVFVASFVFFGTSPKSKQHQKNKKKQNKYEKLFHDFY